MHNNVENNSSYSVDMTIPSCCVIDCIFYGDTFEIWLLIISYFTNGVVSLTYMLLLLCRIKHNVCELTECEHTVYELV